MSAPEHYDVIITTAADRDLNATGDYIDARFSRARAAEFAATMSERIETLSIFPLGGGAPAEAVALGLAGYRQMMVGLNRVIYEVEDGRVTVVLIADGRRDMQALLRARLLGL